MDVKTGLKIKLDKNKLQSQNIKKIIGINTYMLSPKKLIWRFVNKILQVKYICTYDTETLTDIYII